MKCVILSICLSLFGLGCSNESPIASSGPISLPPNVLDYSGDPDSPNDRSSLIFSDQGAWFGFGLSKLNRAGFSGPFLMTQGQGEWSSAMLSELELLRDQEKDPINWSEFSVTQTSYNSHLEQLLQDDDLKIVQTLFYSSAHSALITTQITNKSEEMITLQPSWRGVAFLPEMHIAQKASTITLITDKSPAKGFIQAFEEEGVMTNTTDSSYIIALNIIELQPGEEKQLTIAHTFIFPEYDFTKEQWNLEIAAENAVESLGKRITEKEGQLTMINHNLDTNWRDRRYKDLVAKAVLTLQNNTRIAAGELKYDGLFPSYHYKWFLGFWAWDSWKHAAALSNYDPELAKNQIRVMYDFQLPNGFIVDCVYRDTSIEQHNYRNTKPPLSGWAVWKVYEKDKDLDFIDEMYPKILRQHKWWYLYRDHDKDGICEYGSTDGTLVAAKWESGMDNAVRFDNSEMVKSAKAVFSLNQESVDLNSYLYAEKIYLLKMATILNDVKAVARFEEEASDLKTSIQSQFFDAKTGWFYDTSIDGEHIIRVMGCEGWIPLWAKIATDDQAEAVKTNMMDPNHFYTKVPFQTLSADHPDFKPDGGYWRGPNWLDQAYFGVMGLHSYGYHEDAYEATYKLMHCAEGVLSKGLSIRENYNPITGGGLESQNFSWSAAHYLLLLLNE